MSLLGDPQVIAALISLATVGMELAHEVWCHRRRFMYVEERRSVPPQTDLSDDGARFSSPPGVQIKEILIPVFLVKDTSR